MERVALRCHYEDVPLSVIPGIIEWCPTVVHVPMNGLNAERRGLGIRASLASCVVIVIPPSEADFAAPSSAFQRLDANGRPVAQYLRHAFHQLVRVVADADHRVGPCPMRLHQHRVEGLLAGSLSELRKE